MTFELEQYIEKSIGHEPEYLKILDRDTHLRLVNPRMCSGHIQGRLLKMIVRMVSPKRVLELGTFTGYSALCIAEGLNDGATIDTIEHDEELRDFIVSHLATAPKGISDKINLHFGDATQIINRMEGEFDLVFIDADKREYSEYYRLIKPKLKKGGIIVADNTLWDGHVIENGRNDPQTDGIRKFNQLVAEDEDVEKSILPVRDGLTIIYKK